MKDGARILVPDVALLDGIACVGCGCSQEIACETPKGPCRWAAIDIDAGYGLCSACAVTPIEDLISRGFIPELIRL